MVKIVNDDDDDDDDDDDEDCCSEGKSLDNIAYVWSLRYLSPITKVLPYSITVILYIRVPLIVLTMGKM